MMKRAGGRIRWAAALGLGLAASPVFAGDDEAIVVQPTGPVCAQQRRHGGLIRRAFHKTSDTIHRHFIGEPEEFIEPPLGFYLYETIGAMKAKADPHQFTLYNSDFLIGSNQLSPAGARRLNTMAARLPRWMGPMVIEWTPEDPALAEARKITLLALFENAHIPMVAERIVVAPSQYTGFLGTDAANNYNILISRDVRAGFGFSLSPTTTATFSGGGSR